MLPVIRTRKFIVVWQVPKNQAPWIVRLSFLLNGNKTVEIKTKCSTNGYKLLTWLTNVYILKSVWKLKKLQ